MIRNLSELPSSNVLDYDIAIAGGGAAGVTLALELQSSGLRVGLLEGGGLAQTTLSQQRYQGEITVKDPLRYPPLDVWRLRFLGGSTNHWEGWARRLEERAFLPRPGVSEDGWPWPRTELDAGYARAHELCEQIGRALV